MRKHGIIAVGLCGSSTVRKTRDKRVHLSMQIVKKGITADTIQCINACSYFICRGTL